jgi:ribonuclease BN (tRNA processing enzyme)
VIAKASKSEGMQVRFIGCGDAFGSGGRFNTCFHVTGGGARFLIDCGASSLIAMKRFGVDRNGIEAILITHFHGDHFGGIPYFMLDALFFSKRVTPLTIAGPPGLEAWFARVMETTFPGSSATVPKFDLRLVELEAEKETVLGAPTVTPYLVKHDPGGAGPFLAYRIAVGGRVVAYTGDTEWTDALIPAGRDADLFISEAYFRDKRVKLHLDVASLERHLAEIGPRRVVLTHMSDEMLGRIDEVDFEVAEDGKIVRF